VTLINMQFVKSTDFREKVVDGPFASSKQVIAWRKDVMETELMRDTVESLAPCQSFGRNGSSNFKDVAQAPKTSLSLRAAGFRSLECEALYSKLFVQIR